MAEKLYMSMATKLTKYVQKIANKKIHPTINVGFVGLNLFYQLITVSIAPVVKNAGDLRVKSDCGEPPSKRGCDTS